MSGQRERERERETRETREREREREEEQGQSDPLGRAGGSHKNILILDTLSCLPCKDDPLDTQ